jgi:hypothetical protein
VDSATALTLALSDVPIPAKISKRIKRRPRSCDIPIAMPKFVPRQRKHKAIARRKHSIPQDDANTAEILPEAERERAEQKRALKDELLRETQGKISGKKKKRLDKYIVRAVTERSHLGYS